MTTRTPNAPLAQPRRPRSRSKRPAANAKPRRMPHVLTLSSGKGGVGKTHLTANLAWHLSRMRRRVLVLDADMGLANIDIMLGLKPDFNLTHALSGEKTLAQVLTKGPAGMRVLPAASGLRSVKGLNDAQQLSLLEQLETLEEHFDYVLIDTGAGITPNVIYFNLAAHTILTIVTPDPASLTDAYALIKILASEYHQRHFKILANDVSDEDQAMEVFQKLTGMTDRHLNVSLDYLGHVPHDEHVREAVCRQQLVSEVFADEPAACALSAIARRITTLSHNPLQSDLGLLWRNTICNPEPAQTAAPVMN